MNSLGPHLRPGVRVRTSEELAASSSGAKAASAAPRRPRPSVGCASRSVAALTSPTGASASCAGPSSHLKAKGS